MIEITIPGFRHLRLNHLVMDYNGTLANDGKLISGVKEQLHKLSHQIQLHVLTTETYGLARSELNGIPCMTFILPGENQDKSKLSYVKQLRSEVTATIGNGRSDSLILKEAALGIVVSNLEGMAVTAIQAADLVIPSIRDALDLFYHPLRLIAALRT